ncbi:MAG: hypothetical protein HRT71_04140 [Flavobacteriales bacterium]|nr:hypothetical protein [Flavobacteriales bacterium]
MGCKKLAYYFDSVQESNSETSLQVVRNTYNTNVRCYVFGMVQPGREFSGDYRYGYQGSEKDNEIKGNGNSYTTYFRSLDPRLGRWMSLDPVTQPHQSPYNSMDNNPIMYNDPNGDWIPKTGENGDVTYTAEEDDNFKSFVSQYDITEEDATAIFEDQGLTDYLIQKTEDGVEFYPSAGKSGLLGEEFDPISITLDKVLKVDFKGVDGKDVINQTLFAFEHAKASEGFMFDDYFSNISGFYGGSKTVGFGGAGLFKGYTTMINGEDVYVQMMLNQTTPHSVETTPTSRNNWFVPHSGYYFNYYNSMSGSSYPTTGLWLKFKGKQNMTDFSKKYGFRFSGINR